MSEALSVVAGFLALLWGLGYGVMLWRTPPGRWLRLRRTWLSVVIGVGVDLVLGLLVVKLGDLLRLAGIVALSGIGIVSWSLWGTEYSEHQAEMRRARPE